MRRIITAGVALAAVGAAIVAAPAAARPSHSVRVTTFSVVEHVRSAHRRGNTFITRGVLTEPGTGGADVEGFDKAAFTRTAQISKQFGVIKKSPSGAYRDDLAKAAVAQLQKQGVDVYGKKWKKAVVKVTAGGK